MLGFHHVTAIAGDPQRNLDFYAGFLGMRLVKRTVNFDDPGTYHFYFGDSVGAPGTLLTFFPWAGARRRARRGAGQVVALALAARSLEVWRARAHKAGVSCSGPNHRMGEAVLTLEDPDGLPVELIEGGRSDLGPLHSVTIAEREAGLTAGFLTGVFKFDSVKQEDGRQRLETGGGAARIDVLHDPAAQAGVAGPGSVHHVALAAPNEAEQDRWRHNLIAAGFRVTLPQNRLYFRSIYFRPDRNILFELATSSPGFTVDEPPGRLGERLCLPPWLEPVRESIEQRLPRVAITEAAHG
jgi:glyoxalase family protein